MKKMIMRYYIAILFFCCLSSVNAREGVHFPKEANFLPSYPYISGCTFRMFADFIHDSKVTFDPLDVRAGDVIFVIIDLLDDFFENFHPKIRHPYILLIHHFFGESDDPNPAQFGQYLDDPKLIAWFTHNPDRIHPKLHPLPIGVPNEYNTFGKRDVYNYCFAHFSHLIRPKLCYLNFSLITPRQEEFRNERQNLYNKFQNNPQFTAKISTISTKEYLRDLSEHKFVLCPRGNGLATFRTWETLLMRRFPVVKSSPLNSLFEDLPVVIIDDWNEVSQEFLEKKYKELKNKKYNWEKVYIPYWLEEIHRYQIPYGKNNANYKNEHYLSLLTGKEGL